MDCNVPTDIVFSFRGLCQRGGRTGPHADGWGLGLYEGRAARLFLEPSAAANSPLARFVSENPIKTLLAIGHVRKRTHGPVSVENTHPFVRELWGRHWVFAHNGSLRGDKKLPLGHYRPVGTTDSEHAFCYLLDTLREAFAAYPKKTSELFDAVARAASTLSDFGSFNFLLGDGRFLYARCGTRLCHIVRKAPFGIATLSDDDVRVDFAELTTPNDSVAIIATVPLTTDEEWTLARPGELWVFEKGAVKATLQTRQRASQSPGQTPRQRRAKQPKAA